MTQKDFNIIFEEYQSQIPAEYDILSKCKTKELVLYRALFYKILIEKHGVSKTKIGKYTNMNHASVINALRKFDSYLKESDIVFKYVYGLYYVVEKPKRVFIPKKQETKLESLINTIPEDKLDEIYELVNLRIKSWSWKSKDYCKIIEGYSPMTHTF